MSSFLLLPHANQNYLDQIYKVQENMNLIFLVSGLKKTSDSLSIFPLYLFPFFSILSPTLGPNELCSLVVTGSQMCCCSCQCNGMVCDANTHMLIHTLPAHQNGADAQVTMLLYPFLLLPTSLMFHAPRLSRSLPHVVQQPAGISSEVAQCWALLSAQGPLDL